MKIFPVDDRYVVSKFDGLSRRISNGDFTKHLKQHNITKEEHDALDFPGITIVDKNYNPKKGKVAHFHYSMQYMFWNHQQLSDFAVANNIEIFFQNIGNKKFSRLNVFIDIKDANIVVKRKNYHFCVSTPITDIIEWCAENDIKIMHNGRGIIKKEMTFMDYPERYNYDYKSIFIEDENDAVLFSLRWADRMTDKFEDQ